MSTSVTPAEAKRRLHGGAEIAFLDVREPGEFGEDHPLFAVPCPYSRLEIRVPVLVPRRGTPVLLIDGSDGVAERAAAILAERGYGDLAIVAGGTPAWAAAGLTLFKGVNVPSKTLGELAEHRWAPPTVDARTLADWRAAGRPAAVFDARPPGEHTKMRVPDSVCIPNGELAHRLPVAAPDPETPLVLTCAGRTRGLLGVLGLRFADAPNPLYALENGTQGWALEGFALERGAGPDPLPELDSEAAATTRARADAFLAAQDIPVVHAAQVAAWQAEADRTTFLFDVRAPEDIAADPAPAFTPALSGQLVQATDRWVGVRRARLVLLDDLGLRAGLAAFWLARLGFETAVARIDDALRALPAADQPAPPPSVPETAADAALADMRAGTAAFVDLRASAAYRAGHMAGAVWGVRPRLDRLDLAGAATVYLITDDAERAALAARDLRARGVATVRLVGEGHAALAATGIETLASERPAGAEAIDFLDFVHDRHDGNLDASRRYLAWEQGLTAALDPADRAEFGV